MPRPIAKDYDKKRQQILKSAAAVFAKTGSDRASMAQLAAACGISKANIYHYFPSKGALHFAILDTHLSTLCDRICGLEMAQLPAPLRLKKVILETLMAYEGADNEHRLQAQGFSMLQTHQQAILKGYQRDLVAYVSDILLTLSPQVFETDKTALRNATMSIFGMLNWYFMWNTESSEQARRDYAEMVSALAIGGIQGLA